MVVVQGRTYNCKEGLKEIGGIWDPVQKVWRVPKSQRFVAELLVNNADTSTAGEFDSRKLYSKRNK